MRTVLCSDVPCTYLMFDKHDLVLEVNARLIVDHAQNAKIGSLTMCLGGPKKDFGAH